MRKMKRRGKLGNLNGDERMKGREMRKIRKLNKNDERRKRREIGEIKRRGKLGGEK